MAFLPKSCKCYCLFPHATLSKVLECAGTDYSCLQLLGTRRPFEKKKWNKKLKSFLMPLIMKVDSPIIDKLMMGESIHHKWAKYEPPRGKTNNVVYDQVRHKTTCTFTEKS